MRFMKMLLLTAGLGIAMALPANANTLLVQMLA